ncbi:MAG: TylF/MycF family methyltransferase [Candidatus Omnitrophica bacterium]|nr:TylF/MycF family methyltransferase [Candidatus Omnitrophota bacterium]
MFNFIIKLKCWIKSFFIGLGFGNWMLHKYRYEFSPQQLFLMCNYIRETKSVEGDIAEIGCYFGDTTVFLNKFMDFEKIDKRYICVDTFTGFDKAAIDFEKKNREKTHDYRSAYIYNNKKWFEETMRLNGIKRVEVIRADICSYDFCDNTKLSFTLIDLDLYSPTKSALEKVYRKLSKNGVIIVDDCRPSLQTHIFDGALAAYREFVKENNLQELYLLDKLGIIVKNQV